MTDPCHRTSGTRATSLLGHVIFEAVTVASEKKVVLFADLVYVLNYTWVPGPRLQMEIQLFPDPGPRNVTTAFTKDEVSTINGLFSNWKLAEDLAFGPYEFITRNPSSFYTDSDEGGKNGISARAVVGIVQAAVAATAILLAVFGIWFFRRHKKQLMKWRPTRHGGFVGADEEKLGSEMRSKVRMTGLREFKYKEVARTTDNFSIARKIGQGGYGQVYSGAVEPSVELVAIKCAEEDSLQGSREFYTKIELLSLL